MAISLFQWFVSCAHLTGAIFDWSDVYAKTGFYYAMNKILRQKKNQFNFSTIIEDVSINDSFQLVQKSKSIFNNKRHVLFH